jgi:hypothetical protein
MVVHLFAPQRDRWFWRDFGASAPPLRPAADRRRSQSRPDGAGRSRPAGSRIITLDDGMPWRGGRANGAIVFVGSNTDVAKFVGPATRVINLAGQTAIPGFIEGHGHFTGVETRSISI